MKTINNQKFKIAKKKHLNELFNLFKSSWDKWYSLYENIPFFESHCKSFIKNKIKEKSIYICTNNKIIIGYLIFYKHFNNIHIEDLFVSNNYRNTQIASTLLNNLTLYAQTFKYISITAECDTENEIIINFNKKHNFTNIGLLNNYWDKNVFFFKKSLLPPASPSSPKI